MRKPLFYGHPIIRQVVDRLHVGDSDEKALEYARSRLNPGAYDAMTAARRRAFDREVLRVHHGNRALYTRVMAG